jgi:hypothetical protein
MISFRLLYSNLILLFLSACVSKTMEQPAILPVDSSQEQTVASVEIPLDTAWVYLNKGAVLWSEPGGGDQLAVLPEGAEIDLLEPLIPLYRMTDTLQVDGLEGKYIRASIGDKEGWIFSGGLGRLPHPALAVQDWGAELESSLKADDDEVNSSVHFEHGVVQIQERNEESIYRRLEMQDIDFQQGMLYALATLRADTGSPLRPVLNETLAQVPPKEGFRMRFETDQGEAAAELLPDGQGGFYRFYVRHEAECESWLSVELNSDWSVSITKETGC